MAINGFSAQGFMNGLVGGLEAAHNMHSNDLRNELFQREAEDRRARIGLDAINKDMERQKLSEETQKLANENDRNHTLQIAHKFASHAPLTNDDFNHLATKSGLPWDLISDTPKVQRLQGMTDEVVHGKRDVNDPEFQGLMSEFHNYRVANRGIGQEAEDPETGTRVKVTGKQLVGFDRYKGNPMLFAGRVRVDGTDLKTGKPYSYTSWASRDGTSDPNDPYALVDARHILGANAGMVALNRRLEADPDARQRLSDALIRSSISPDKQADIDYKRAQIGTQQSQQTLNAKHGALYDKQGALADERQNTERSHQYKDYNPTPRGTAQKPPRPEQFSMNKANDYYEMYGPNRNESKDDEDKTGQRARETDAVRQMMKVSPGLKQNDAHDAARKGPATYYVKPDGTKIPGYFSADKKQFFPIGDAIPPSQNK